MYSPEAIQFCSNRLTEVPKPENDYVLDLSIRTQEETNGCHGDGTYANEGYLSPDFKSNHSSNDSNGFNGSPTFLPLPISVTTRAGKPTRPFKAYPKNFLGLGAAQGMIDDSNIRYIEFRRQFLSQLHATSGGNGEPKRGRQYVIYNINIQYGVSPYYWFTSLRVPQEFDILNKTTQLGNKNMKRPVQSVSPNQLPSSSGDARDQAYWERRRKNNEAAKKSRDARRAKEDEIAIRAAFLERENIQLRLELESLKGEVERLRCVLYTNN